MSAETEAILRGLIDAMTERADELQRQAVNVRDDSGNRKAECAAGVRQARTLVEGALAAVKVLDADAIYVIYTKTEDEVLWWSNDTGWGDQASVTRFTEAESRVLNLPEGGTWCELAIDDGDEPSSNRDAEVLDALNLLLSAPEWPGASGMEDVCELVRTVRTEVPDAPEWESH